jgi:Fe-S-cluster-containing hydrogenase component 2
LRCRHCAMNAIVTRNGRPYWTLRCESCMKCITRCPRGAIEISHLFWLVFIVLASTVIPLCYRWIFIFDSHWLNYLVELAVQFAVLCALYYIFHILLKFKLISKIITFFSLTHYHWWGKRNSR